MLTKTKKSDGGSSSMFSNMKLKKKVLLGFSSVLAIVGSLGGVGYYSLTKVGGETPKKSCVNFSSSISFGPGTPMSFTEMLMNPTSSISGVI